MIKFIGKLTWALDVAFFFFIYALDEFSLDMKRILVFSLAFMPLGFKDICLSELEARPSASAKPLIISMQFEFGTLLPSCPLPLYEVGTCFLLVTRGSLFLLSLYFEVVVYLLGCPELFLEVGTFTWYFFGLSSFVRSEP